MTAVTLFTQGNVAIPDYLKNVELDDTTKKLAGNGGGMRISIRGSVWRLMNGGEEISRNEDRAMNVVVVASSPDVSRNYYDGPYEDGQSVPPTCWSSDDKTPDANVPEDQKQSASCATCPQNIAGSGNNGESRACKYARRLAVALENDPKGGVYQLQLPAQSIFGKPEADGKMPLQAYAKLLVQNKLPINAVVTEMRFDTNSSTPKVTFRPVRPLTQEEYERAKEQGQSQEAQEAIRFTVFQTDTKKTAENAAGIFAEKTTPEQAAAVQQKAEEAPKRTRAKPKAEQPAAAQAAPQEKKYSDMSSKEYAQVVAQTPLSEEDEEEAELERKLAAKRAAKAAAAAAAAQVVEPVVVKQHADPAPQPAGVASILEEWDDPA
jgi:hypothetical protein